MKVTIIGIVLHYLILFLKRLKIFKSHYSFKFGLISALFYLIAIWFLKLKLTILCRVDTQWYESIFG